MQGSRCCRQRHVHGVLVRRVQGREVKKALRMALRQKEREWIVTEKQKLFDTLEVNLVKARDVFLNQ